MKEVKIQIPEGYEIDKEKSTFEFVRFKPIEKPIEKFLTYEDICSKMFKDGFGYYIQNCGNIKHDYLQLRTNDKNNATTEKQLERLLALNQLLNIAEYYNRLHAITPIVFTIMYSKRDKMYYISTASTTFLCGIKVFFNRREDAQAVIDNPDFREILDIIYK